MSPVGVEARYQQESVDSMSTVLPAPSMADPVVTANIYCSRYINDLLREAVAPFRSVMHDDTEGHGFLWFFRYGKRGEHLKLRLHAPEPRREALQVRLEQTISPFLETIGQAAPIKRLSKSALPAVDVEDEADEDHPDRAMLWTRYRRSPVIVGDPIYARDDHHMARFTRAAAASADFILGEVLPASREPTYLQRRQSSFLKLIIAGMAATDFAAATWPVYFTYHHDWLVRHLVVNSPVGLDRPAFEAEIAGHLEKTRAAVPALARVMAAQRAQRLDGGAASGPLGAWTDAVRSFFEYVRGYRGRPEYNRDPYTDDHSFLPLFKVFHACANQLGLRISNEAYLYRLLLEAAIASVEDAAA
jgi:hypothetical protein